MGIRHGDTLIEVAIAIAIFSLVSIGVVSVVSSSTSAAQSALEITVTREQIDAQAEALRFIHDSYVAGGRSNSADNEKYRQLWNAIVANANASVSNDVVKSCADIYDPNNPQNIFDQKAFIINTHTLGDTRSISNSQASNSDVGNYIKSVVVTDPKSSRTNQLTATSTYPRLVYTTTDDAALLDAQANATASSEDYYTEQLLAAEGIYIVAVKDQCSTTLIDQHSASSSCRGSGSGNASAFYDFYIRTCWYGPGADTPSTISTVIRLQDPEILNQN